MLKLQEGGDKMNFSWDECTGEELIIRKMILGDVKDLKELIAAYGLNGLRNVFLQNLCRFNPKERSFWQAILEVKDEELEQYRKSCFREGPVLRYFP